MNCIESLARPIDKHRFWGIVSLTQQIHVCIRLDAFHSRFRISFLQEASPEYDVLIGKRFYDEISFGNFTFIIRGQYQILPTLTFVRTGIPQIRNVPEKHVVDHTQRVGRALDHNGAIFQIENVDGINRFGVGREKNRLGVHQVFKYSKLFKLCYARPLESFHQSLHRSRRDSVEKSFNTPVEIQLIV